MKGGSVTGSPSNVGVPSRLCVGVPLVVRMAAVLNGGCGVCCEASCSDWSGTLRCYASPCIVLPFTVFTVTALLV